MKQKHLPEIWYLKIEDKLEINNKKYRIHKVDIINSCHPEYCEDERIFYLEDDYALIITIDKNNVLIEFCKVIRPNVNTMKFEKIELKTLKVLK